MSAIEFPSNPVLNQEYTHEGVVWKCEDATYPIWAIKNPDYLPIDGTKAMTGQLSILPVVPTAENHAVRKDYADLVSETITAIDALEINSNSVIDVFIYDTNRDSDSSWLNPADVNFPSVTIMTLESGLLTIYDANDRALNVYKTIVTTGARSVIAKQGIIYIASGTDLISYDIALDYFPTDLSSYLVSTNISKLAIKSDDNGDNILGVATDAAVTFLYADTSKVNITATTYIGNNFVGFTDTDAVYITAGTATGDLVLLKYNTIPTVDTVDGWDALYSNSGNSPDLVIDPEVDGTQRINTALYLADNLLAIGYPEHFALLKENSNTAESMVHFITTEYVTGWQKGDIQGTWLASTDTRTIEDTELILNGTFTSLDDWIKDGLGTLAIDTQRLLVTNDSTGTDRTLAYQVVNTEIGKGYRFSIDGTSSLINPTVRIRDGVDINAGTIIFEGPVTAAFTTDFVGISANVSITLRGEDSTASGTSYYDNVSLGGTDLDRSYQATNLKVFGFLTKSLVNTGAELIAYEGFSVDNYLEQTDARFANTLYTYGWVKDGTNGWEFKHGVVSANPIDGLTIAGTILKIAGTLPKALIRLGSQPSGAELTYIEATERELFLVDNKCTIQGSLPNINALGYSLGDAKLVVCSINATTIYNELNVIGNSTTISTSIHRSCGGKEVVGN